MQTFNNTSGTTSSEFQIGAGTAGLVRHFVLTANSIGTGTQALDREGNKVSTEGIEFYDLKFVAKDSAANVTTKWFRGTINGTQILDIEDVYQEDANAGFVMSVVNGNFEIECSGGADVDVTIYLTMTRV